MKEFPIEKYTPVLVRDDEKEVWSVRVFEYLRNDNPKYNFGTIGKDQPLHYAEMAPLAGNEGAEYTRSDVSDLWDRERLIKEGFIDA